MGKRRNRIIAVVFLLTIAIFGVGTLLKCENLIKKTIVEHKLFSKATEIEASVQENFKSRNNWINLNGLFQKIMGMTIIRDAGGTDVYRLRNGQIMYNLDEQDVEPYAVQLKKLYGFAQKNKMDFLYVQLPFKIQSDNEMPMGAKDAGNVNADELVESLKIKGIPLMDIRKEIKKQGYDYKDLFFNTDHHWRPKTALWAAGLICHELEISYGWEIDKDRLDMNSYNIKTKKDWFLGSLGKRTGAWYAGTDDFDIITPKFNTLYTFKAVSENGFVTNKTGDFSESLLKREFFEEKNYFNVNTYAGYTGGDYALNTVINHDAPNDKSILLVRDSFSCALMPFLTMGANKITTIDLRYYKKESLVDYIRRNHFDIIIVAYNPSAFTEKQFGFF